MKLILSAAAIVVLSITIIDGSFDYNGFDPWDRKPDLSDGFFTIQRIIVSLAALYSAHLYYKDYEYGFDGSIFWSAIFGFIFILFQPVFPVRFDYETWLFIDLAVVTFIASELYFSIWIARRVLGALQEGSTEALELDVQSPNAQPRASTNPPRKKKPKNPMVAALDLDNQTYARFIEDAFIDMDSNTRAHVLVAYRNLKPALSAITRVSRKNGIEYTVETFISDGVRNYEKAVNEGDEVNSRRFAWFLFAALLKRLEEFAEEDQKIADIGAKIWLLIAQDAPILKVILPDNVVWQPNEKTWFDLNLEEDKILQDAINHHIPLVFFKQTSVKEFARSKNFFYSRLYI